MGQAETKRVVILGGGFAGLTVAMELDKKLVEVILVNRDNLFVFTPMLHEVAASDLDLTTIVNPIRKVLRHVQFFVGQIEKIDLEQKSVIVSHGFDRHHHVLSFDFLVVSLGSVTNFHGISGLDQHALTSAITSSNGQHRLVHKTSLQGLLARSGDTRGCGSPGSPTQATLNRGIPS